MRLLNCRSTANKSFSSPGSGACRDLLQGWFANILVRVAGQAKAPLLNRHSVEVAKLLWRAGKIQTHGIGAGGLATMDNSAQAGITGAGNQFWRQCLLRYPMGTCWPCGARSSGLRLLDGDNLGNVSSRYAHAYMSNWDSLMEQLPSISNQTSTKH